jgi:hypothetical protein
MFLDSSLTLSGPRIVFSSLAINHRRGATWMGASGSLMTTPEEYEAEIKIYTWAKLKKLWKAIKDKDTPDWEPGKAFEYMILRSFQLNGAKIHWPYSVKLFGEEVEQIDGSVQFGSLYALVESKDETGNIAITPIAKLRNQLLRRPAGTIGLLFSSRGFTDPAIQLAYFALPQAILLWTGDEVEYALEQKNLVELCEVKYRACVDFGMLDFAVYKGVVS